ncbi:glycosyltransferase family 2 protein [Erythrobacter sp. THAF29]|uniref:glycosyltransferase family 2 protein n=1 Tax=Erythrobacter sp. THAF29 TaxID=2587851 RepID=UPI0015629409|nr:glycosyltransferase family 2 protein [Erythrobacter sp. THAF29]
MVDAATNSDSLPALSILIVAYNSRHFIRDCIAAIPEACADVEHEVIMIDNGDDGTAALVEELYGNVRILPSRGNIGFGSACNMLAAEARGRRLVLLNPDTIAFPGSIAALHQAAQKFPEFAAIGGASVDRTGHDPKPMLSALPRFSTVWRGMIGMTSNDMNILSDRDGSVFEVEAVNGGFCIIDAAVWRDLGGFDESFFLYGEDVDLSLRIAHLGKSIGYVPSARVFHDVGSGDFFSPASHRFKTIAAAHYANKHFSARRALAYKLVLWLHFLVRYAVGGILGFAVSRYRSISRANRPVAFNPNCWWHGFKGKGADPRRSFSSKLN